MFELSGVWVIERKITGSKKMTWKENLNFKLEGGSIYQGFELLGVICRHI